MIQPERNTVKNMNPECNIIKNMNPERNIRWIPRNTREEYVEIRMFPYTYDNKISEYERQFLETYYNEAYDAYHRWGRFLNGVDFTECIFRIWWKQHNLKLDTMGKADAIEEDKLLQNLNQLDLLSIWQLTPEEEMAMKNAIAESEKIIEIVSRTLNMES